MSMPGQRLVAPGEGEQRVEPLGVHHRLDRVGDDLARHERGPHALVAHGDPVRHGDGDELDREPAGVAHAVLGPLGQPVERHVARRDLVPRRRHPHLGLGPVVVGHADGPQHGPGRRTGGPVGDLEAADLHAVRSRALPVTWSGPTSFGAVIRSGDRCIVGAMGPKVRAGGRSPVPAAPPGCPGATSSILAPAVPEPPACGTGIVDRARAHGRAGVDDRVGSEPFAHDRRQPGIERVDPDLHAPTVDVLEHESSADAPASAPFPHRSVHRVHPVRRSHRPHQNSRTRRSRRPPRAPNATEPGNDPPSASRTARTCPRSMTRHRPRNRMAIRPGPAATAARRPTPMVSRSPARGSTPNRHPIDAPRHRMAEGPDEEQGEEGDHGEHCDADLGHPTQGSPYQRRAPEPPHHLGPTGHAPHHTLRS